MMLSVAIPVIGINAAECRVVSSRLTRRPPRKVLVKPERANLGKDGRNLTNRTLHNRLEHQRFMEFYGKVPYPS
jgi:hypothetical protein